MTTNIDIERARELDSQDELAAFRNEFVITEPDLIYLDGNSLGRLPKRSQEKLQQAVKHGWGDRLIRAWNDGWFNLDQTIGARVGQLLGAAEDEVIFADSTSVNLYKLTLAALNARRGRTVIVTDDMNFPSDHYVLQGIMAQAADDFHIEVVKSPDDIHLPLETLAEAIDENTALVTLSHTTFKSGYTYDMAAVNQIAHDAGALTLWDLSHSAGSVPMKLRASVADLAVGCSYKYLNGGPGAPAFMYVRSELQDDLINPIAGWFSQENQFGMDLEYTPTSGMRRFLTGTAPTLSLLGVEGGVELMLEAGMDRLREKSVRQTEYLIELWEQKLEPLGYRLNSPRDPAQRGSHVSLGHDQALGIDLALIEELDVLPDFRYPDNIRLGIAPIYTRFEDIHEAVSRLEKVVSEGLYQKYAEVRPEVT